MAKKFSELRARMSPDSQARAAARAEAMLLEMQLQELRKARSITQIEVARSMSVEQAAISRLERREDMYVSTLRDYIRALGGELKLVASFPDADIQVRPFEAQPGSSILGQLKTLTRWQPLWSGTYRISSAMTLASGRIIQKRPLRPDRPAGYLQTPPAPRH